ncbi:MAG: hypothetical protein ACRDKU_03935, partial [Gaiellaceae bacterium]
MPSARVRFAFEAAFLVLVATGAALAELRPLAIIVLMAAAWLLVALIERASSREPVRAVADVDEPPPSDVPPELLPAIEPSEAYRWLFWRRARARMEELAFPTASLEERPSRSHVRRIEPEPEPEPAAPTAVTVPEPEESAPGPAVTTRPLELPGLEEPPAPTAPAPPPRPRFASLRPRPAEPPVPPPPPPAPPA